MILAPSSWEEGQVPRRLPEARVRLPLFEAAPGEILFRFPTIGRFLLRQGRPTVVELFPTADRTEVEGFMASPLRAALALLDGRFSMRASALALGATAVIVTGPSSAATSAFAAVLTTMGIPLVADEVVATDPARGLALPGGRGLVLNPRTAEWLGFAAETGRAVRPGLRARSYAVAQVSDPLPIREILWMDPAQEDAPTEFGDVLGMDKVIRLTRSCWHGYLIDALGLGPALFAWSTLLAGVPMSTMTWGRAAPEAVAARYTE